MIYQCTNCFQIRKESALLRLNGEVFCPEDRAICLPLAQEERKNLLSGLTKEELWFIIHLLERKKESRV